MAFTYKFHRDHVGSLLRPPALLEARRRVEAGMIEPEELREVEDEEITAAVRLQESRGFDLVTDGEFRRDDFRTGFVDAVDGFAAETVERPWQGKDGTVTLTTTRHVVVDRLKARERIAAHELAFLKSVTTRYIKVTLISPGFIAEQCWKDGVTDKVYESREELAADVAAITRSEIESLFAEGALYVQIDNPRYTSLLTPHPGGERNANDVQAELTRMLAADASTVEGIQRPEGAQIGIHICRGNQASLWLAEGSYEPIAERLFNELPVDRFLLEFDDERSGGLDVLRFMPEGKVVVLGLISTKTPELEDVPELVDRIDEAAKYVEIDDLAVSPQCGFASVGHGGNNLTIEDEAKKLQLVTDTSYAAWGFEG